MKVEIRVPSPGESVTQVEIARWLKADGEYVKKDEEICEIDSDKATLAVAAAESGVLKIKVAAGETIKVGDVICFIDTEAEGEGKRAGRQEGRKAGSRPSPAVAGFVLRRQENKKAGKQEGKITEIHEETSYARGVASPAAAKIMREKNIDSADVNGTGRGGRITKQDVDAIAPEAGGSKMGGRNEERKKMSSFRRKLAERLVAVKNQTAMLTTFNEVDMSAVLQIRKNYKESFEKKFGVKLGFMSFFTKAVCEGLKNFPAVNAMIDGDEIIYHPYMDIAIAVSAPKGLMVPVVRNAERQSFAQIESEINRLAEKARTGTITIDEMTGGTFTITNGGIFGSMLSTPILNPPQSAILGMHNIVERPVVMSGKIEIRPVMYIALSYDHRIIDGRESVGFLVNVKEMLENPLKVTDGGKVTPGTLLGL